VTNPIDALFTRLRSQQRKAFIPFLTAGDPSLAATTLLAQAIARAGADLIEIGFPYSDPIADGPVIQASYTRALERGLRLTDLLASINGLSKLPEFAGGAVPRVAMASYSLIYRRGADAFITAALAAGIAGAVVPDLPLEEADDMAKRAKSHNFKLILLVTPTTPPERARTIARCSSGFLYCVSITGITGERDRLPPELLTQLAWLRGQTDLPLCVGFGISRPEHVAMLREAADGVIVGSALVRLLEKGDSVPLDQLVAEMASQVRLLVTALNP
jgi:tryptophan synthase alpha chain